MKDVSAISQDVKKITGALAASVGTDQGRENIKATLENLAQVTEALNQTVRENRESIRNITLNVERITAEGRPQIQHILENVRVTTGEVRELLQKAEGPTGAEKPGDVRQIVEKVNRASSSLDMRGRYPCTARSQRRSGHHRSPTSPTIRSPSS
jgi:phospholipid/cholesterol/gamma-HCH transport system substrate-binding protein